MSVLSPPEPREDELELLIREARARQRKRWVGAAALVAILAGTVLGIRSIATAKHASSPVATGGGTRATTTGTHCGFRVAGTRVLASDGSVVYRDPSQSAMWHELRCSGSAVWVVFVNGVGMSHEDYVGVRSSDAGRSWRVVFAERFFNAKAPHQLVTGYLGPWTLSGPREAYFTGTCVACGRGTVSLWVTKDGGRTFRRYQIPALTGYGLGLRRLRVKGQEVIISARSSVRGVEPPRKTVAVHLD